MKLALTLLALATVALADVYTGHKVVRIFPNGEEQVNFLHSLHDSEPELDFWTDSALPGRGFDIRMSPEQYFRLSRVLKSRGMDFEIMIEDVQALVDSQKVVPDGKMDWVSYQTIDEIYAWMDELAAQYDHVTVADVGTTFEGRALRVLRINRGTEPKQIAMIESLTHAREWITGATTTWIVNEILTNAAYDYIMDTWDLHFFLVANPDGYSYTWTDERFWRKNRFNDDGGCAGIDLNRNWPFQWNTVGSSNNPCSDTYHGASAGSELETQAWMAYGSSNGPAKVFQAVHSYSQYILLPWSYTSAVEPPNFTDIENQGFAGEAALEAVFGTQYLTGNTVDILYAVGGGSFDYFLDAGTKWSIGWELRDTGEFGFALPADQILDTAEETWAGMRAMLDYACSIDGDC